jgi:hypothetical protein
MKNFKPPKPPKDLTGAPKKLWVDLQAEYQITDAAGLTLLTDACRFFMRLEQAREIIRREGPTTKDRFGQAIAHPATRIERDSSAAMIRSLKSLNLDIEPLKNIGRPPGK